MQNKFQLSSAEKNKIAELMHNSQAGSNQWILSQILLMRDAGKSLDDIAAQLDISLSSVKYVLKRYRKIGLFQTFTSVVIDTTGSYQAGSVKSAASESPEYPDSSDSPEPTLDAKLADEESKAALTAKLREFNLVFAPADDSIPSSGVLYDRIAPRQPQPAVKPTAHIDSSQQPSPAPAQAQTPQVPVQDANAGKDAHLSKDTHDASTFEVPHKGGLGFLHPLVSGVKKIFHKRNDASGANAAFNPNASAFESAVSSTKSVKSGSSWFSHSNDFEKNHAHGAASQSRYAKFSDGAMHYRHDENDDDYYAYEEEDDLYGNSWPANRAIQAENQGTQSRFAKSSLFMSQDAIPSPKLPDLKIPTPSMSIPQPSYQRPTPYDDYEGEYGETYEEGLDPEYGDYPEDRIPYAGSYADDYDEEVDADFEVDTEYPSGTNFLFDGAREQPIGQLGSFSLRGRKHSVLLKQDEYEQLEQIVQDRGNPDLTERLKLNSKILLMCAHGHTNNQIEQQLNLTRGTVSRIKRKFFESGLDAVLYGTKTEIFQSEVYRDQVRDLIFKLIESMPSEYGYSQSLWTSNMVQDYFWKNAEEMGMPDLMYASNRFFLRTIQKIVDENPEHKFYVRIRSTKEKEEARQLSSRVHIFNK